MDQQLLKQLVEELREIKSTMVSKDDAKKFLTKDDAKNFATKDDLVKLKKELSSEIIEQIKESEGFIVGIVDKNKVDRAEFEALNKRVSTIEKQLAS